MLIFYIIGFLYLVICFSVLAGDELWFRFKCQGWPGLPGMFYGSLKGKKPGFWSLDFFSLKYPPVPATAFPFLLRAAPILAGGMEGSKEQRREEN